MGKRKERRLAAKTASNRRVKLDLLAEPSGDFGDSSTKEVGGDGNATNHAGSPNSPSSSGQGPENPLLLLGQYSDEEVEEESSKEISRDTEEKLPTELHEQAKVDSCEGAGADEAEDLTAQKVDQENMERSPSLDALHKVEEDDVREDDAADSLHKDTDAVEQISVPETCDTQMTGDVDSGWKMVFHEESNSYYYWNIVTGETSWEVPVVLVQGTESAIDPKPATDVAMDATVSAQPIDGSTNTLIYEDGEIDGSRPELDMQNERYTNMTANDEEKGNLMNITNVSNAAGPDGANYGSLHEGFASFGQSNNVFLSNGEVHNTDSGILGTRDRVNQETVDDPSSDSSRLLQLGEYLQERLKPLKGSKGQNENISKLMFELDIRLEDIKSLVPYGSSLLPFWLHSENQLKKLEAAIDNEVLKCSESAKFGEQDYTCEVTVDQKYSAPISSDFDTPCSGSLSKEPEKVSSNLVHTDTVHGEAVQKVSLHSDEDIDMDVEMEVEDTRVEDEPGVQKWPQQDQPAPPDPDAQHDSLRLEDGFEVPPPPNDDWVPPPPPDDEPLPPLPPEEPPEASFPQPPSEIQTVQPYSYGEHYNLTYPGSSFEYYGQTNAEVPSNGYYVDTNVYYSAVPNPYPDATAVVNSGDPVAYYTLQDGSVPTASTGAQKDVGFTVLASSQVDVSTIDKEMEKPSTEVSSVSVSTHDPATSTSMPCVSVVSAPAVAATVGLTEPVSKAQPKVTRNKKRTVATMPTLRSNKKVSGLVDKWKAVKEELQEEEEEEEEDEPENAYEVLEKKRQREIEQWHAQQIATGEAKDNANFQPLGGDWRERVRRKRAKKSREAEGNLVEDVNDGDPQPDLDQLTKQLPPGWQAYWDEGSKKVYYGNSCTSETTWTKPKPKPTG